MTQVAEFQWPHRGPIVEFRPPLRKISHLFNGLMKPDTLIDYQRFAQIEGS